MSTKIILRDGKYLGCTRWDLEIIEVGSTDKDSAYENFNKLVKIYPLRPSVITPILEEMAEKVRGYCEDSQVPNP